MVSAAVSQERRQLTQWIYMLIWLIMLVRGYQSLLVHQLMQPVFISPKADNFFWLLHLLYIPQFFVQHPIAALSLDACLVLLPFWGMLFPNMRLSSVLFALSATIYYVLFNSVMTHHEHTFLGLVFFAWLLCIKDDERFVLGFKALRYYVCFVMVSAAVWKLARGSFWHSEQMINILKVQHLDMLTLQPEHWHSQLIYALLERPKFSQFLWQLGTVFELVFVLGWFTQRLDKFLLFCFLGFFVLDYVLMRLAFFEFCIFALVFIRWKGLEAYYTALKVTK